MNQDEAIQILLGALADIGLSEDMTLKVARAKAKRVYLHVSQALVSAAEGTAPHD